METVSALLAICAGNSPITGEFPTQRPLTRRFNVFFDLRLNIWLSKQSRRGWFETPSFSLWRHCNEWLDWIANYQCYNHSNGQRATRLIYYWFNSLSKPPTKNQYKFFVIKCLMKVYLNGWTGIYHSEFRGLFVKVIFSTLQIISSCFAAVFFHFAHDSEYLGIIFPFNMKTCVCLLWNPWKAFALLRNGL